MDNGNNKYKETNLADFFALIKKNIYFILTITLIMVLIGLGFSIGQELSNPTTYRYSSAAKTKTIEGWGMERQKEAILDIYTSGKMKNNVFNDLKVDGESYNISANYTTIPNEILITVVGPSKKTTLKAVNSLIDKTASLIEGSMPVKSHEIIEYGVTDPVPIVNDVKVNYVLNMFVGLMLGLVLSIFIVVITDALNPRIRTEDQLRLALSNSVTVLVADNSKEKKYLKFLKVR